MSLKSAAASRPPKTQRAFQQLRSRTPPKRRNRHACRTMVMIRNMAISTHSMTMHIMARPDFWVFSALTSSLTPSSTYLGVGVASMDNGGVCGGGTGGRAIA